MRVGFFCYENSGGDAMSLLAQASTRMGHESILWPKQVHGQAIEAWLKVRTLDVMVTGLSGSYITEELNFADKCRRANVPWVVFEDVPGMCLRGKSYAEFASAVIVAHPMMVGAARVFGYRDNIVYLGPPPQWRVYYQSIIFAYSNSTRSRMMKIRGDASVATASPVSSQDFVIGFIGGNDTAENNRILRIIKQASEFVPNAVIAFSKHSSENLERGENMTDTEFAEVERHFNRLQNERSEMFENVQSAIVDDWNDSEIAAVADVMIYASSGTNIGIAATYARKPGIYIDDEPVRVRMLRNTGLETWFVAELGGVVKAKDSGSVALQLGALSTPAGRNSLVTAQEANFPLPRDWFTEPKIINFLSRRFGPK